MQRIIAILVTGLVMAGSAMAQDTQQPISPFTFPGAPNLQAPPEPEEDPVDPVKFAQATAQCGALYKTVATYMRGQTDTEIPVESIAQDYDTWSGFFLALSASVRGAEFAAEIYDIYLAIFETEVMTAGNLSPVSAPLSLCKTILEEEQAEEAEADDDRPNTNNFPTPAFPPGLQLPPGFPGMSP